MNTAFQTFLATGGIVAVIVFIVFLGLVPILVAKRRKHPSIEAITVCCIVGWLVWPAWFVALVWAYTNKTAESVADAVTLPNQQRGFPVQPVQPARKRYDT